MQDYSKSSVIFIRGEATLKLKTNRTTFHLDHKSNNVTVCPFKALHFHPISENKQHVECNINTSSCITETLPTLCVQFSVQVTPVIQDEVENKVPLWIIIGSVLAGVFLLALIVVLLWKVCTLIRR